MVIQTVSIFRVIQQGDMIRQSSMPTVNATVEIPQIKMTKVHIPFTFRLESNQKDSEEGKYN